MADKLAILINSCDAYDDLWEPFFKLFSIMWKDCQYPLFLNTESKVFNAPYISVTSLHPKKTNLSWSHRLKLALQQIDSDYVLMLLDDFFLMSPVRTEVISQVVNWMDQDTSIVCVRVENCHIHEDIESELEEFAPIKKDWDFTVSTQAAIWRKNFLEELLRERESAWDFESFGSVRFNKKYSKKGYKIYIHKSSFPRVLDYDFLIEQGYGVVKGKWLKGNINLFKKYRIDVDFAKRGFFEDNRIVEYSMFQRTMNRVKLEFNRIKKNYLNW